VLFLLSVLLVRKVITVAGVIDTVQSHLAVPDGQTPGQTIRDSETSGRVKC